MVAGMVVTHKTYRLYNEAHTNRFGNAFAKTLARHDVIGLIGPLGAGKSVLARAIINALSPETSLAQTHTMPSPTFTLIETYETALGRVSHIDLYRLFNDTDQISAREFDEIGFDEAMTTGPVLIEWADRAIDLLPQNTMLLSIQAPNATNAERTVIIAAQEAFFMRPQTALLTPYLGPMDTPYQRQQESD